MVTHVPVGGRGVIEPALDSSERARAAGNRLRPRPASVAAMPIVSPSGFTSTMSTEKLAELLWHVRGRPAA